MTIAVTILGSTGTIGVNTLDVIARHPERFSVFALTAHRNVDGLFAQCETWNPRYAVMVDEAAAEDLARRCRAAGLATEVLAGAEALAEVAAHDEVRYVMAGIVGAAGLLPNLAAARAGKRVMLANKESLVMSGQLFMDAVRESGAELLPIDSEHNAVFQCLPSRFGDGLSKVGVERILLTASGGPFRSRPIESLAEVTPAQAVAHPNWVMGRKISVDSATMMNKGLEVIEACWLFGTTPAQVEVVIHPQSVIHSMVQYVDGSVLAQLGNPDMRTPIAYALAWPERCAAGVQRLDLFSVRHLDFEEPDYDRFPCLRLARDAMSTGGTAPAILNAANEIAVAAFLDEKIRYTDIPRLVGLALEQVAARPAQDLDTILADDFAARDAVERALSHGVR
jgi:1-deoxy-D-xylulose-5-phosphate reductoisomerase